MHHHTHTILYILASIILILQAIHLIHSLGVDHRLQRLIQMLENSKIIAATSPKDPYLQKLNNSADIKSASDIHAPQASQVNPLRKPNTETQIDTIAHTNRPYSPDSQ